VCSSTVLPVIFDKNLIGAAILTKAFWCPLVLESVAKINLALSG